MKISITREKLIALLILLPYVEGDFLTKYIQIYFNETFIRAISVIYIIVTMLFAVLVFTKKKWKSHQGYRGLMTTFAVYTFFQVLFAADNVLNSFCVWIWVSIPMLFGIVVGEYCEQRRLCYRDIIIHMIRWFCVYLVVVLVYNVAVHHLFINPTFRLSPRGGGAVIFGYTIAVVFAFCVQYRDFFSKREYYILLAILSVGALGTESRAAIWPIVFLWIINFELAELTVKKIIFMVLLIFVLVFFSELDFSNLANTTEFIGWKRLFNTSSVRRSLTLVNTMILFGRTSFMTKIFGVGLNDFFPYQKWVMQVNDVDLNMITRDRISVLVQPHNSFLYALMESGLLGFLLLLGIFIYAVWSFMHYRTDNYIFKIVFVGVIFLANCFDSVFYVQPGAAGTLWLLLIITINENKQKYYEQRVNI